MTQEPDAPNTLRKLAAELQESAREKGLSFRDLERLARHAGKTLPRSTIHSMLTYQRGLTEPRVRILAEVLGEDPDLWAARLAASIHVSSGQPVRGASEEDPGPLPEPHSSISEERREKARWWSTPKARLGVLAVVVVALVGGGAHALTRYVGDTRKPQPAAVATQSQWLGKPDFAGYCQQTGQGDLAYNERNKGYGYRCTNPNSAGLDAQNVCAWTYKTKVTNRIGDFNDATTWQCWTAPHGRLGALDFRAYCTARGQTANLIGDNAYSWHCGTAKISGDAACRVLYPRYPAAVSRFQTFYDPDSWECWA
ncbi:hypothetical protein HII36_26860 [Nonomuraea sp. NN258]|uniref:hypothetical protein n=1 Tax=Nonomuraea antri TaxID=2730852 RepID=UPI001569E212|nr:hypothetical protein [Nonomuraea antri]NRQ35423.1 hypothetical protein [Nonomuraea antri]